MSEVVKNLRVTVMTITSMSVLQLHATQFTASILQLKKTEHKKAAMLHYFHFSIKTGGSLGILWWFASVAPEVDL